MKNITRKLVVLAGICSLAFVAMTGRAFADSEECITSIKNSIEADQSLGAHDLKIYCRQRSVILDGTVASVAAQDRILNIAKNTQGVEKVTDWMFVAPKFPAYNQTVRLQTNNTMSDNQIAENIRAAVAADNSGLADKVTVSVNNGIATLHGNVNNFREADQTLATTLMVNGVHDINSELTINGKSYETQKFTR